MLEGKRKEKDYFWLFQNEWEENIFARYKFLNVNSEYDFFF